MARERGARAAAVVTVVICWCRHGRHSAQVVVAAAVVVVAAVVSATVATGVVMASVVAAFVGVVCFSATRDK